MTILVLLMPVGVRQHTLVETGQLQLSILVADEMDWLLPTDQFFPGVMV